MPPALEDNAEALLNSVLFFNAFDAVLGGWSQISDPGKKVRSNYYSNGGFDALTDSALAATGVGVSVPIPVWPGQDTITAVSILVGAAAAGTPTHGFAALLVGGIALPTVIVQSADTLTTAIPASLWFTYTLTTPTLITTAMAPYGYIYAQISATGTTIQTAASYSTPTALQPATFPTGLAHAPIFQSFTSGSGLAGTAVTVASPAAKATQPLIVLS